MSWVLITRTWVPHQSCCEHWPLPLHCGRWWTWVCKANWFGSQFRLCHALGGPAPGHSVFSLCKIRKMMVPALRAVVRIKWGNSFIQSVNKCVYYGWDSILGIGDLVMNMMPSGAHMEFMLVRSFSKCPTHRHSKNPITPKLGLTLGRCQAFPGGSEVKASACNAGDLASIPELGRSPGEGNGNPLQYSCLVNPMEGGAW